MGISAINRVSTPLAYVQRPEAAFRAQRTKTTAAPHVRPAARPESPPEVEPVPIRGETSPDGSTAGEARAHGVLRNLLAGHFRGVADVRLRINFFSELQRKTATSAAAAIEEQAAALAASVAERADELLGPMATDEQTREALRALISEFQSTVTAIPDVPGNQPPHMDTVTHALQTAFEEMARRVQELLTPTQTETPESDTTLPAPIDAVPSETATTAMEILVPVAIGAAADVEATPTATTPAVPLGEPRAIRTEKTVDGAVAIPAVPIEAAAQVPVEPEVTSDDIPVPPQPPTQTLADSLAHLSEFFQSALSSLGNAVESAFRLPELSPPRGRGVAYAKFRAAYDELRAGSSGVDEQA